MRRAVVALLMMLGFVAACGGGGPNPAPARSVAEPPLTVVPGAYVGRAGDSDILLAVVREGAKVRAYACDGVDLSNATVNQWFQGTMGAGPTTLEAGGYKVTLSEAASSYTGTLALPDGRSLPFTATRADGAVLLDAEVRDPATGTVTRDGNAIVLGDVQRGAIVSQRPPRCPIVRVTGSGGQSQYVTVC